MMICRALSIGDAQTVAELHFNSFKGFFLTSLGKSFLRVFYKGIISHSNGLAIGLFEEGELVAFAVGSKRKSGFYSDLIRRRGGGLGLCALPQLALQPSRFLRLLKSLKSNGNFSTEIQNSAILLSICVAPDKAGNGLGTKILMEFEHLAFCNNSSLTLTTDSEHNDAVNSFYLRNEYKLFDIFLQDKRKMNIYIKKRN